MTACMQDENARPRRIMRSPQDGIKVYSFIDFIIVSIRQYFETRMFKQRLVVSPSWSANVYFSAAREESLCKYGAEMIRSSA